MASYAELDGQLTGRNAERRKLANNTWAERRPNGDIAVRLHGTDVVTYHPDGSATLTTGGWYTVTTKDRLNGYGPHGWHVWSERGRWVVSSGPWSEDRDMVPFVDGLTIDADGSVRGRSAIEAAETRAAADRRKVDRDVKRYVAEYVAELAAGNLAMPNGGDCWGCLMVDADGQTVMGADHLRDHMTERYYVPSLAVNALRDAGMRPEGVSIRLNVHETPDGLAMGGGGAHMLRQYDEVARVLRRYMRRQLIPGAGGARPARAGAVSTTARFGY